MLNELAEARLRKIAIACRVLRGADRKDGLPRHPVEFRCDAGHVAVRKVKRCHARGPADASGKQCGLPVRRIPARCRLCDEYVPTGRVSWCSEECQTSYYLATSSSVLRYHTYLRDKGVCADCELDCAALEVRVYGYDTMTKLPMPRSAIARPHGMVRAMKGEMKSRGFDVRGNKSFWQADHIEAVEEGGSWRLVNVQTLCAPCHKKKTAEHATRRASIKKLVGKKFAATIRQRRTAGMR